MRILIIGGTGLISTPVTQRLLERGDDVTLLNRGQSDIRFTGEPRIIQGDRRDHGAFQSQVEALGVFDCVIDMVMYEPEEAESAIRAFRGRTRQFLFCSTVDVYSRPAREYPIREEAERRPSGEYPYAFKKSEIEEALLEAHQRGDLAVTIIRPAHTYGETRSMLNSFGDGSRHLDRLRRGKPIIVHGDGSSLWASCHADDVAGSFVAAAGDDGTYGKSYHVTGEEWVTWDQFHQRIATAMDAPEPRLVHIPTDLLVQVAPKRAHVCKVNFQYNNIFDNSAARRELGFRYTVPLEAGVRRIVAWLDERGRIENSDDDPFEDRVIAAWERLGPRMAEELAEG